MRGSRNKFQGEGVQAWRPENSLDHFFFSPQLVLQLTEGVQWFYYRENILFQGSRVGPTFSGGGGGSNFSEGGGVQLLISMETHITCDFPGRVWTPFPLDPHMVLIHVHPRQLVLYIQGTRLLSTVLVQPRNQAT